LLLLLFIMILEIRCTTLRGVCLEGDEADLLLGSGVAPCESCSRNKSLLLPSAVTISTCFFNKCSSCVTSKSSDSSETEEVSPIFAAAAADEVFRWFSLLLLSYCSSSSSSGC
jgi:hypothetical protein